MGKTPRKSLGKKGRKPGGISKKIRVKNVGPSPKIVSESQKQAYWSVSESKLLYKFSTPSQNSVKTDSTSPKIPESSHNPEMDNCVTVRKLRKRKIRKRLSLSENKLGSQTAHFDPNFTQVFESPPKRPDSVVIDRENSPQMSKESQLSPTLSQLLFNPVQNKEIIQVEYSSVVDSILPGQKAVDHSITEESNFNSVLDDFLKHPSPNGLNPSSQILFTQDRETVASQIFEFNSRMDNISRQLGFSDCFDNSPKDDDSEGRLIIDETDVETEISEYQRSQDQNSAQHSSKGSPGKAQSVRNLRRKEHKTLTIKPLNESQKNTSEDIQIMETCESQELSMDNQGAKFCSQSANRDQNFTQVFEILESQTPPKHFPGSVIIEESQPIDGENSPIISQNSSKNITKHDPNQEIKRGEVNEEIKSSSKDKSPGKFIKIQEENQGINPILHTSSEDMKISEATENQEHNISVDNQRTITKKGSPISKPKKNQEIDCDSNRTKISPRKNKESPRKFQNVVIQVADNNKNDNIDEKSPKKAQRAYNLRSNTKVEQIKENIQEDKDRDINQIVHTSSEDIKIQEISENQEQSEDNQRTINEKDSPRNARKPDPNRIIDSDNNRRENEEISPRKNKDSPGKFQNVINQGTDGNNDKNMDEISPRRTRMAYKLQSTKDKKIQKNEENQDKYKRLLPSEDIQIQEAAENISVDNQENKGNDGILNVIVSPRKRFLKDVSPGKFIKTGSPNKIQGYKLQEDKEENQVINQILHTSSEDIMEILEATENQEHNISEDNQRTINEQNSPRILIRPDKNREINHGEENEKISSKYNKDKNYKNIKDKSPRKAYILRSTKQQQIVMEIQEDEQENIDKSQRHSSSEDIQIQEASENRDDNISEDNQEDKGNDAILDIKISPRKSSSKDKSPGKFIKNESPKTIQKAVSTSKKMKSLKDKEENLDINQILHTSSEDREILGATENQENNISEDNQRTLIEKDSPIRKPKENQEIDCDSNRREVKINPRKNKESPGKFQNVINQGTGDKNYINAEEKSLRKARKAYKLRSTKEEGIQEDKQENQDNNQRLSPSEDTQIQEASEYQEDKGNNGISEDNPEDIGNYGLKVKISPRKSSLKDKSPGKFVKNESPNKIQSYKLQKGVSASKNQHIKLNIQKDKNQILRTTSSEDIQVHETSKNQEHNISEDNQRTINEKDSPRNKRKPDKNQEINHGEVNEKISSIKINGKRPRKARKSFRLKLRSYSTQEKQIEKDTQEDENQILHRFSEDNSEIPKSPEIFQNVPNQSPEKISNYTLLREVNTWKNKQITRRVEEDNVKNQFKNQMLDTSLEDIQILDATENQDHNIPEDNQDEGNYGIVSSKNITLSDKEKSSENLEPENTPKDELPLKNIALSDKENNESSQDLELGAKKRKKAQKQESDYEPTLSDLEELESDLEPPKKKRKSQNSTFQINKSLPSAKKTPKTKKTPKRRSTLLLRTIIQEDCDDEDLDGYITSWLDGQGLMATLSPEVQTEILDYLKLNQTLAAKIRELDIQIDWDLPKAHLRVTVRGLKKQEGTITGPYSKEESKQIMSNWKKFCKLYGFDKYDFRPFLPVLCRELSPLEPAQKRKFALFLSKGLDKRVPFSVYGRFVTMTTVSKKGHFSKSEDKLIMYIYKNAPKDYFLAICSLLLQRSKFVISRRFNHISEKKNFLNSFCDANKTEGKKLDSRKIGEDIFKSIGVSTPTKFSGKIEQETFGKIASEYETHPFTISRLFYLKIQPAACSTRTYSRNALRIDLIKNFNECKYSTWESVDWNELSRRMSNVGPVFLYSEMRQLMKELTNSYNVWRSLKKCIKLLNKALKILEEKEIHDFSLKRWSDSQTDLSQDEVILADGSIGENEESLEEKWFDETEFDSLDWAKIGRDIFASIDISTPTEFKGEIPREVFEHISSKYNIPTCLLVRLFYLKIQPAACSLKPIYRDAIRIELIKKLSQLELTWDSIDWEKLSDKMSNVGPVFLYSELRQMAMEIVPSDNWHDFKACMNSLNEALPKLEKTAINDICLKRLTFD